VSDKAAKAGLLLEQLAALGLSIDDLVAASAGVEPAVAEDGPTVSAFIDSLKSSTRYSPRTLETYKPYWKVFIRLYGDRPLRSITPVECETVVETAYQRAKARYPDRPCRSSKETCVGALRAVFARARKLGIIDTNPALSVDKPRRTESLRRALTPAELEEVWSAVAATTRDPGLDLLLLRFHLWSGARREGAVSVTLADLDKGRCSVWLHEKFGKSREQPVPPSLIDEIAAHAAERGAAKPTDALFRTRRGAPLHRRHYNALFDKVQARLQWPNTPVTAHVLRHTAISAVERVAGYAVAVAYAGHQPTRAGVTGTYVRASVNEVAAAIEKLSGEPHPLSTQAPGGPSRQPDHT